MKLLDKIKERKTYWEEKIYTAQEKGLLERIDKAKARKTKVDRLNALEKELSGYLPKEGHKSKRVGFAEGILKNSYNNLNSGNKGKKRVKSFFG